MLCKNDEARLTQVIKNLIIPFVTLLNKTIDKNDYEGKDFYMRAVIYESKRVAVGIVVAMILVLVPHQTSHAETGVFLEERGAIVEEDGVWRNTKVTETDRFGVSSVIENKYENYGRSEKSYHYGLIDKKLDLSSIRGGILMKREMLPGMNAIHIGPDRLL